MKVLVTGGAGFIGSAVVRLAIARGNSVVNVDSLTYAACLDNLDSVAEHPNYAFEQVDIRNRTALDAVFSKHSPDAVMHLAAESHVDRSIDGPADFIETNVNGTFNMLEATRSCWQAKVDLRHSVSITSARMKCLDRLARQGCSKTHPMIHVVRILRQKQALIILSAWFVTYGLPVVMTNCSNNYGPFQFPES